MNIFGGTKYEYAEEDRLTNALLAVFEHCEGGLVSAFLDRLSINILGNIDNLSYSSQISYLTEGSRPDGMISNDEIVILIENKRFNNLDPKQLERHIKGIKNNEQVSNKYLLCISNDQTPPIWLSEFKNEIVIIKYISWSLIYRLFDEYNSKSEVTKMLISHFLELLSDLGYSYYKEDNMNNVLTIISEFKTYLKQVQLFKTNHENLLKIITSSIDNYCSSHKWQYNILDESKFTKYGLLSDFHTKFSNGMTFNFEMYENECIFCFKNYSGIKNIHIYETMQSLKIPGWDLTKKNNNFEYTFLLSKIDLDKILEGNNDLINNYAKKLSDLINIIDK